MPLHWSVLNYSHLLPFWPQVEGKKCRGPYLGMMELCKQGLRWHRDGAEFAAQVGDPGMYLVSISACSSCCR